MWHQGTNTYRLQLLEFARSARQAGAFLVNATRLQIVNMYSPNSVLGMVRYCKYTIDVGPSLLSVLELQ